VIYDLLFKASSATMLTIAADRKHLGARIDILSVPHPSPACAHDRAGRRDIARWQKLAAAGGALQVHRSYSRSWLKKCPQLRHS
jgi:hypothetical protein